MRLRLPRLAAGLSLLIAGCMPNQRAVLSASDAGDLGRVTAYLNGLPRFEAHFEQSGAFGPGAGVVWIDRPGNLRIDYQGAGARLMVISAGRVRILDRASGALTTMALSRTPLGMLLTDRIALSGAVTVDSVGHGQGGLRVVLKKTDQPAQGRLTLDFTERPLRLQAVSVTDVRGQTLTMNLTDIDPSPLITPGLFAPPVS